MAITKTFDVEFKIVTFTTITDGPDTGGVSGVWKASINGTKILYDEVSDGLYKLLEQSGAFDFVAAQKR